MIGPEMIFSFLNTSEENANIKLRRKRQKMEVTYRNIIKLDAFSV